MSIHETGIPGLKIQVGPNRVEAIIEATVPAVMRAKNRLPAGPDNPADVVVMEEQNLKGSVLIFSGSLHEKNVFAAWALQLEESAKPKPTVKEASLAGSKGTESK